MSRWLTGPTCVMSHVHRSFFFIFPVPFMSMCTAVWCIFRHLLSIGRGYAGSVVVHTLGQLQTHGWCIRIKLTVSHMAVVCGPASRWQRSNWRFWIANNMLGRFGGVCKSSLVCFWSLSGCICCWYVGWKDGTRALNSCFLIRYTFVIDDEWDRQLLWYQSV